MPPRHAYWTIILEGKPTAFRAHTREELAPTLRQLQARHPDAVLMWFARGRLWASPEQEAGARRDAMRERRGPGWRPGGAHRDPRERFRIPRDEKRRRFAARARRDRLEPRHGQTPEAETPRGRDRDRPRDRERPRERDRQGVPKPERPWERDRPGAPPRDRFRQGDRREDRRGPRETHENKDRFGRRPAGARERKPGRPAGGRRQPGGGRRGGGRGGGGRSR